jgi:hypothetical protein
MDNPGVDRFAESELSTSSGAAQAALAGYGILTAATLAHVAAVLGWLAVPAGAAVLLEWAYGWWAALTLILAIHQAGGVLARLPPLGEWGVSGWAAALFRYALGSWALACLLLLLALLRSLEGPGGVSFAFLTLALAGWSLWKIGQAAFARKAPEPATPASDSNAGIRILVGLALILWFVPYLIQTLLPNLDYDSHMYHLPLGRRLLHGLAWAVDPNVEYLDFPALPNLFYAALFSVKADEAVVPFVLLNSLGLIGAVYVLTERFWGRLSAALAALVLLTVSVLWQIGVTAKIDGLLTLYFTLATFAFLLWREDPRRRGLLPMLGLLVGLGLGAKYTAVFFLPALGGAVLLLGGLSAAHRRALFGWPCVLALVLLLVPAGFWYGRNALVLGDPMYTLLLRNRLYQDDDGQLRPFQELRKERVGLLISSKEAAQALRGTAFHRMATPPGETGLHAEHLLNLLDMVLHPRRYDTALRHFMGPFFFLGLLSPLVVRDRTSWWLFGIALAFYLPLAWRTITLRYVLPSFALWACGSGVLLAWFWNHAFRPLRWVTLVLVGGMALYLCFVGVLQLSWISAQKPWDYLAGVESRPEYLCRVEVAQRVPAFINRQIEAGRISPQTCILFVGELRGELVRCSSIPDHSPPCHLWFVEVLQAGGDLDELRRRLRAQGIEYLLINVRMIEAIYHGEGTASGDVRIALAYLNRFAREQCEPVHEEGRVELFRLR